MAEAVDSLASVVSRTGEAGGQRRSARGELVKQSAQGLDCSGVFSLTGCMVVIERR
jgi:hypothetical protein